jgi:hypothetical protein
MIEFHQACAIANAIEQHIASKPDALAYFRRNRHRIVAQLQAADSLAIGSAIERALHMGSLYNALCMLGYRRTRQYMAIRRRLLKALATFKPGEWGLE